MSSVTTLVGPNVAIPLPTSDDEKTLIWNQATLDTLQLSENEQFPSSITVNLPAGCSYQWEQGRGCWAISTGGIIPVVTNPGGEFGSPLLVARTLEIGGQTDTENLAIAANSIWTALSIPTGGSEYRLHAWNPDLPLLQLAMFTTGKIIDVKTQTNGSRKIRELDGLLVSDGLVVLNPNGAQAACAIFYDALTGPILE